MKSLNSGRDAFHRVRFILPLCAFVSLWLGCSSTPPTESEAQRLQRIGTVVELAAYTGAAVYLIDHPDSRDNITRTITALDGLSSTNGFSPAALHQALSTLPIKELKSEKGQLLIGAAVILYEAELSRIMEIQQPAYVAVVGNKVRAGLQRALDAGVRPPQ